MYAPSGGRSISPFTTAANTPNFFLVDSRCQNGTILKTWNQLWHVPRVLLGEVCIKFPQYKIGRFFDDDVIHLQNNFENLRLCLPGFPPSWCKLPTCNLKITMRSLNLWWSWLHHVRTFKTISTRPLRRSSLIPVHSLFVLRSSFVYSFLFYLFVRSLFGSYLCVCVCVFACLIMILSL